MEGDFSEWEVEGIGLPQAWTLQNDWTFLSTFDSGGFTVSVIINISFSGSSALSSHGTHPPSAPPILTARRSRRHSSWAERSAAQHGSLARRSPPRRVDGLGARLAAWLCRKLPPFYPPRLGSARAGSRGGAEAGGRRHGLKSRGRKRAGESHEPAAGQPARQRAAVRRLQPGPRWGGGAGPCRAVAAGRCGAVPWGGSVRFGSARSVRAVRAGRGLGAGLPLRWRSGLWFQRPSVERRVSPPSSSSEEGSDTSQSWLGAAGSIGISVFPGKVTQRTSRSQWQRCNFVSDLRSRAADRTSGQTRDAAGGRGASERFSCFICPLWEKPFLQKGSVRLLWLLQCKNSPGPMSKCPFVEEGVESRHFVTSFGLATQHSWPRQPCLCLLLLSCVLARPAPCSYCSISSEVFVSGISSC